MALAVCCLLGAFVAQHGARGQDAPGAKRPPWTSSRVRGAPEPPAPYRLAPAFPKLRFELPTCLEQIPGTERLLVTERSGKIFSFAQAADVQERDLVLDLRALLPAELAAQNVSLFDAAVHPNFPATRALFVCYVHPESGGQTRLSRFLLDESAVPRAVPNSEQVVLTWPAGGHNAGCLEFGSDGYLYIATGDGSGPNPPDGKTTGQDVSDLLGAILRIDIDQRTGRQEYSIPADNPFVGMAGARAEIWAYGLRNPWKFGVDPASSAVFAADNGWESWEMVHQIVRGGNCGWPIMEGRAALRTEVPPGPTPIRPPVKDHPHTEANSVIGGPVYRGSKLPDLVGSFVYGDYITGTIWSIRPDKDGSYSHQTLVDTDQRIVAFRAAASGELYVLDYDLTGQIYELLPSNLPDLSAEFPRRLSETGLFASLKNLEPAPGVAPYSVLAEPWMDGAQAARWIAVPGAASVELPSGQGTAANYPDGTVFVKHLTLPQRDRAPRRLETQLLHFERGVWNPYSYVWDEQGQDAELVGSQGTRIPLRVASDADTGELQDRTWYINATNECKLCHNAGPKFVLGFVANQLAHHIATRSEAKVDQLAALAAVGVIKTRPAATEESLRLVNPHDDRAPLNDRARSYLHANCAMCHHPGGNAIVSFFLRRDLPFEGLNTNKGTGIGTFGLPDARIISPGDPYRSVLMYRMAKLGYARMPYIGSQVVDSAGVGLVAAWIRSLPADSASAPASSPLVAGGDAANLLSDLRNAAPSAAEREQATRRLMHSTDTALALAIQLHGQPLPAAVKADIASHAAATTSDVRGLFDTFVPESQRRATLGATIDPQPILSRQGDRQRGKLIYFSDGARCRACHEIDDPQQSLGPTLQEINKKYPRRADLLQHVLQPALKIDDVFAAYLVQTTDGRVLSGLLASQNDGAVVLKTADKKLTSIPREQIADMQRSPNSLMPDRILSDLTAQEAADLLEYLQAARESAQ